MHTQGQTGTTTLMVTNLWRYPIHVVLGIVNGTTPDTTGFVPPPGSGSIRSEPDETTILERFAALGLAHHADQSGAGGGRI
jgi:hypothetical protein